MSSTLEKISGLETELTTGELDCLAVLWLAWEKENSRALRLSDVHARIKGRCQRAHKSAPAKSSVSTFLRSLTKKGYLQETSIETGRTVRPSPLARSRGAAPVTRSPKTAYRVVVEPGAILRRNFAKLVDILPPSWRERAVRGFEGAVEALGTPDDLRRLEESLETARNNLGASSCTLYIRDPWWADEYRLVFMPGVKYPETMHGFNIPDGVRRMIADEWKSEFVPDVHAAGWTEFDLSIPRQELGLSPQQAPLFERFANREGNRSCARLQHKDEKGVKAVLFVNFATPMTFEPDLRERIRALMDLVVERLPSIDAELQRVSTRSVAQGMRILQPIHRLANLDLHGKDVSLRDVLELILGACLEAFGITKETGLGTIHLFEPETRTLVLAASGGGIDDNERPKKQSVSRGEGIISWVALSRRPLLIADLDKSAFKSIHVSIRNGIHSEMTVPLLSGKEVVGVLNLESIDRGAFSAEDLRLLCHAAHRAATAYRLRGELAACREQIALLQQFVNRPMVNGQAGETKSVLKSLAEIACRSLKATYCDIWRSVVDDKNKMHFQLAEASDPRFSRREGPRAPGGWTEYIWREHQKVWIANVESEAQFDAFVWNDDLTSWKAFPPGSQVPRTVSPRLQDLRVKSELGIPLLAEDKRCLGVAWLKYDVETAAPSSRTMDLAGAVADMAVFVWYQDDEGAKPMPSEETMNLADQFATEAARVMAS